MLRSTAAFVIVLASATMHVASYAAAPGSCAWPGTSNCSMRAIQRFSNVSTPCKCMFCDGYRKQNTCACRGVKPRAPCAASDAEETCDVGSGCHWLPSSTCTAIDVGSGACIEHQSRCMMKVDYADDCELTCGAETAETRVRVAAGLASVGGAVRCG